MKNMIINIIVPLVITFLLCLATELIAKNLHLDQKDIGYISRTFGKININNNIIEEELEKFKNPYDKHPKVVLLGGSSVQLMRNDPRPFKENFYGKYTIVNLGTSAFTSFGVRENFIKSIKYKPALVVIYSGHNNYWSETEELTSEAEYLSGLTEYLFKHSNVYRYLFVKRLRSNMGESARTTANPTYKDLNAMHVDNKFIKFSDNFQYGVNEPNVASVDQQTLSRIHEHEDNAIRKFQGDMQYIIKKCKERNIPLIFVTPVSNPNTYDYYLSYINSPKSLEKFSKEYLQAENLLYEGDYLHTFDALEKMAVEYPENGLVAAFMAAYYDQLKDYKKSTQYHLKTIELNLRSHRAKEPLEEVIRGFEDIDNQVYVLDIERLIFSAYNTDSIENMGLFIDYLHPSQRLYYLLGHELNKLIHDKQIL